MQPSNTIRRHTQSASAFARSPVFAHQSQGSHPLKLQFLGAIFSVALASTNVSALPGVEITNRLLQPKVTYEYVRRQLLDQRVRIVLSRSTLEDRWGNNLYRDWSFYEKSADGSFSVKYKDREKAHPPKTINGMHGKIVSVLATDSDASNERTSDIFGKPLPSKSPTDPQLKIVVQLDDGTLIGTVNRYGPMVDELFVLRSKDEEIKEVIGTHMPRLSKRIFFTNNNTELYPLDTPPEDFVFAAKRGSGRRFPSLNSLRIVDYKYVENDLLLVVKVQLEDQSEHLLLCSQRRVDQLYLEKPTQLQRLGLDLLEAIPSGLTSSEVRTNKKNQIATGMSRRALLIGWGNPDEINDYGRGGEQCVYGRTYVYLRDGRITDIQSFGR